MLEFAFSLAASSACYLLLKPLLPGSAPKPELRGNVTRLARLLERRAEDLVEGEEAARLAAGENGGETAAEREQRVGALKRAAAKAVPALRLSEYEQAIAEGVVDPADMRTSFSDIGGIDGRKAEMYDLVVMPLRFPALFREGNVDAPRGILLYGAPGTGKTMLAKAIAKEGGACFVNVKLSR
ncbi:hypothetical protein TeGR_g5259 [Tetraparma gracilis]|uniref:ATPase AAA-type core domain-containing protein n=1 Tax=Tetraparma gracilis TaxID=2962635 RepID=A0ABQ6NAE1_9STRA|nr:hypothetical protein TeGR_g5259 [Tetraparma gracilis]